VLPPGRKRQIEGRSRDAKETTFRETAASLLQ
jgi:hypothetical protein